MIRILQCIGSLEYGGAQSFIMEVYRKIDRNVFQFDFVTYEGEVKDNVKEIEELGGKIYVCPRYSPKKHFVFMSWWKKFFKEHKEYSVVHSHLRSCAALFLPIAKSAGCFTIVHSHSTSNGKGLKSFGKKILQMPLKYIADYLFACSEASGQWLYGKNVLGKKNFKVIPNCIDISRFLFSEEKRENVRKKYNIASDDFVIGHVGRLSKVKNHKFLIDIFSEITKQKSNAKLLLVGDGELRDEVRAYSNEKGLADKVIFTGGQRDTSPFYSAMDVFVFPSIWEGVPLTVVEAQAAGLPCLISDTITKDVHLTDLVETMSIQLLPEKWAEKIECKMEESKRTIGDKQRKELGKYDSCKVAEELEKFYLEC